MSLSARVSIGVSYSRKTIEYNGPAEILAGTLGGGTIELCVSQKNPSYEVNEDDPRPPNENRHLIIGMISVSRDGALELAKDIRRAVRRLDRMKNDQARMPVAGGSAIIRLVEMDKTVWEVDVK